MAKKAKKWIQAAIKKPGALREQMGMKEGGPPIPMQKLMAKEHAGGKLGKRVRLAITLKKLAAKKEKGKKSIPAYKG